jgi:hypothetical protein
VVEERGRVLACGGLWDRGRDLRERWRRRDSGEERVIAVAALLDFGFAEGAEDAMVALLRYFAGRAHELGRDYLAAPIEHLPTLAAKTESMRPEPEMRALRWTLKDPSIEKPYTDLRYW